MAGLMPSVPPLRHCACPVTHFLQQPAGLQKLSPQEATPRVTPGSGPAVDLPLNTWSQASPSKVVSELQDVGVRSRASTSEEGLLSSEGPEDVLETSSPEEPPGVETSSPEASPGMGTSSPEASPGVGTSSLEELLGSGTEWSSGSKAEQPAPPDHSVEVCQEGNLRQIIPYQHHGEGPWGSDLPSLPLPGCPSPACWSRAWCWAGLCSHLWDGAPGSHSVTSNPCGQRPHGLGRAALGLVTPESFSGLLPHRTGQGTGARGLWVTHTPPEATPPLR